MSERLVRFEVDDLGFLAEAGRVLGSSLEPDELVSALSRLTIPRLGDGCVVQLWDDAAEDDDRTAPVSDADSLTVPLLAGNRSVGAMTVHAARSGRSFRPEDVALAEELGRRAGLAVENARLFQEAQSARRRAEAAESEARLLYALTDAVNRAATLDEVYQPALAAVTSGLRVERAAILLYDEHGVMRFRAHRGLSEPYRAAVEGHSPWHRDDTAPAPVQVEDVEADDSLAGYRPLFANERIRSLAFVPLFHERLLGKFMVYDHEPRRLSDDELALASAIAAQIAQAVARKRAQADLERARQAAEGAAAARENMLAVVSHDLRNPLSAISTSAQLLSRLGPTPAPDRLKRCVDTIGRAATRMERLIRDLLDVTSLEAGSLQLDLGEHDPAQLVEQAIELIQPLGTEKGLAIAARRGEQAGVRVRADRDRILQVLSNLLGNAVKFTPAQGSVVASYSCTDREVVFSVEDTGPGIAPELQARVFDRFFQARRRDSQGIGLGLAIARGLVDAHGGRIWLESEVGQGARFFFALPRA